MSVKLIASIWDDQTITNRSHLLVLLVVADQSKDDGEGCWPSIDTIARKTRLSQRTVQDCLSELKRDGRLSIEYGKGCNGTNVYRLSTGGCNFRTPQSGGANNAARLHPNRKEPEGTVKRKEIIPPNSPSQPDWPNLIYDAYPRKVAKKEAMRAIERAIKRGVEPAALLEGARRYAKCVAATEQQFIPYPATWFNGERYLDVQLESIRSERRPLRSDLRLTIDILRRHLSSHPGNPDAIAYQNTPENHASFEEVRKQLAKAEADFLHAL